MEEQGKSQPGALTEVRAVQNIALVAVFTALLWVSGVVRVPSVLGLSITLQTLFVALLALRLRPLMALQAVGLYLLLGFLGLPVFSGGRGGAASFVAPYGGYLWGFVLQAVFLSLACEKGAHLLQKRRGRLWMGLFIALAATLPYPTGLLWLWWKLKLSVVETFATGLVPFIIGDTLKALAAWALAPLLLRQRWAAQGQKTSPPNPVDA